MTERQDCKKENCLLGRTPVHVSDPADGENLSPSCELNVCFSKLLLMLVPNVAADRRDTDDLDTHL